MRGEIEDEIKTAAERFSVDVMDGTLAGWRWPNSAKPPLLFCHATGFCASVYKQPLSLLQADFDVFALDMRGHGRTSLPADPKSLRSWHIYARDVGAFLDSQKREGWRLAGHSMGGASVCMAAVGRSDVAALRLIEPVAMPSALSAIAKTPIWPWLFKRTPMVRQAARRRSSWPSRAEAFARYERKALFSDWASGVLADYLEDGLVDTEDGAVLACAPAWEAATFAAQANDFWPAVRNAPAPLSVLAADHPSTTVRDGARRKFPAFGAELTVLSGAGHLLPMQNPARAARFIAEGR